MVSTRLQSTSTSGADPAPDYNAPSTSRPLRFAPPSSPDINTYISFYSSTPVAQTVPYTSTTHFLDLPSECMEKIFSYLGYKQVSHMRLVSKQLDMVCSDILNSTFQKLQTQMLHRFQSIKAKMPRRESARRNHPLACESDIIETLHMRLTLLQMSFGKHIERKHVCFFAGEILDEVYRILNYVRVTPKLARPYKVTDELFDLSTMAMEYFKERIEITLPEIAYFGSEFLEFTTSSNKYITLDSPPHGVTKSEEIPTTTPHQSDERTAALQQNQLHNMVLRKRIRKMRQGMKRYNFQLNQIRRDLRCCRVKVAVQQKHMLEYVTRLDNYDKKTEETNHKFSTMLQELNKCKTELQYWRSKSPLTSVCGSCGQVNATVPDHGVLLPDLVDTEANLFCVPGTSSDSSWNFQTGVGFPEPRNKRKASAPEKSMGSQPKKPRSVLKSRAKRT